MSSLPNLKSDFKLVTYKNKRRRRNNQGNLRLTTTTEVDVFDPNVVKRRILEAKEDLIESDLYSSFLASLREGLSYLGNREIKEIICFGLGKFSESVTSRFQLSLLLCCKEIYKAKVYIFDPVFSKGEVNLLNDLGFEVLNENVEGKYEVTAGNLSLFYLPHCSQQLTNNLLWRNWGFNLNNCIIVSNSFTGILENNTKKELETKANYICSIYPYTLELAVINSFKYFDIFNDTAIHIFPPDKLGLISPDFWDFSQEPKYNSKDIEFITNKLETLQT